MIFDQLNDMIIAKNEWDEGYERIAHYQSIFFTQRNRKGFVLVATQRELRV